MTHQRIPALDGLRTIACFAVIGYHSDVPWMRDGWLGVDVFFVLSGWLITGILMREVERTGRIKLRRFYFRRAARLYPALILLVATGLGFGWVNGREAEIALIYLSDISRALGDDVGWLGHTWSLSLEEHFYIVWPVVLSLAHRRWGRLGIAVVAGAGLAVSAVTWLITDPPWQVTGQGGFNSPVTRTWELLTGCLLAVMCQRVRLSRSWSVFFGGILPFACVVAILAAGRVVDLYGSGTPMVVVPVTCGLILAVHSGGWATRWLTTPPLPALGVISYGIYLFHFPLTKILAQAGWPTRFVTVCLLSTFLACISWVLIERPIQRAARHELGFVLSVMSRRKARSVA